MRALAWTAVAAWITLLGVNRTALITIVAFFATAPAFAAAPSPRFEDPVWPPALEVPRGRALTRTGAAHDRPRGAWCDFGRLVAERNALPQQLDPLFQTPPGEQALGKAIAALVESTPGSAADAAARARISGLVAGDGGLALFRIGARSDRARVLHAMLGATISFARGHPRLAGFATPLLVHADAAVAAAAVRLHFATGCDTPALYAFDGLRHADASVREAVVAGVWRQSARRPDVGMIRRLIAHVRDGAETDQRVRVLIVRTVGAIGWLPARNDIAALVHHADSATAAEALATFALLDATVPAKLIEEAARSRDPWLRTGAARAIARGQTMRPERARALLDGLAGDPRAVRDPVSGDRVAIATLAADALAALGLTRTQQTGESRR